jgi:hypothetical protein
MATSGERRMDTKRRVRPQWLRSPNHGARGPETMGIFQRLYDSEINFEVSAFYDAGFDVRLGDGLNGFLAEGKVGTWAEVEAWLRDQALVHYPDSEFAKSAQ